MDARHQLAQRGVNHTMLLDQPSPRKGVRGHPDLDVLTVAGRVGHVDVRARELSFQAPPDLFGIDHRHLGIRAVGVEQALQSVVGA